VTPDRAGEALRRAFAAGGDRAPEGDDCPAAEAIFDSVCGDLAPERRQAIVDHVAACAACAADWRLAREAIAGLAAVSPRHRRRRWPALRSPARVALPAAATLFLAIGLYAAFRADRPAVPVAVLRAGEGAEIRSLLGAAPALPRARALLRWTPAGEGARYSIEVATVDLEPVASARGLDTPEYLVPVDALSRVPPGGTIAWTVEARLPDGRRLRSGGFLNRVE
jgi:hypothetical protein